MFSYIAGPCRFCVHCRFATYARVVGLCGFRMHCGIYRICAYCAPLPCLCATWGFAAFACTVGFCFTRACFGISLLSHVPWGLCRTRACFRFRLFRMRRGHLPHPCLLWDFAALACAVGIYHTRACFGVSPLSHVPWTFTTPVPALGFRRFRMCRGHLPHPCLFLEFRRFLMYNGLCRTRACCGILPLSRAPRAYDATALTWGIATSMLAC